MAVRILLVLAVLAIFYGCDQSSSHPEQGTKEGDAEPKSVMPSGPAQQETTQQETTQQRSEAAITNSVGRCTGSASMDRQQEDSGEVSNGKIAFSRATFSRTSESAAANTDIHLIDGEGAHETQLTYTKQFEEAPVWSPDGEKIAFDTGLQGDIYVMDADGTNQTRLVDHPAPREYPAWSPDGGKIVFLGGPGYQDDIYVVNADGTNEIRLTNFINGETGDRTQFGRPVWSPDGSKIAFSSRSRSVLLWVR
jgi:tricorn protease-like protein